jgi:hypothetical protein
VAFNTTNETIKAGLNAKNLTDWADIHFKIHAIVKLKSSKKALV